MDSGVVLSWEEQIRSYKRSLDKIFVESINQRGWSKRNQNKMRPNPGFSLRQAEQRPFPEAAHILILRSCEDSILHSKRDFADVIKWIIWRWEIILVYPGGLRVITKFFVRESLLALKVSEGARNQGMQVASRNQKSKGLGSLCRASEGTLALLPPWF